MHSYGPAISCIVDFHRGHIRTRSWVMAAHSFQHAVSFGHLAQLTCRPGLRGTMQPCFIWWELCIGSTWSGGWKAHPARGECIQLLWSEHGETCVSALSSATHWKTADPSGGSRRGSPHALPERWSAGWSLSLPSWAPVVSLSSRQRPGMVKSFSARWRTLCPSAKTQAS